GGVVPALLVAQGDAGLGGEALDGLGEGEVVDLHHERDGVAALLAAEAVEEALGGADLEGGRLLVVEGAQPLEVAAAGVAQLEVLGDDGVDRDRVPYRLHVLVVDPSSHTVSLRCRADTPGAAAPRRRGPGTAPRPAPQGARLSSGTCGSARASVSTTARERMRRWTVSVTSQMLTFMPASTRPSFTQNAMNSRLPVSPRTTTWS